MRSRDTPPGIPAKVQCELTGLCNLKCGHCYASSGPGGGHGTMTAGDWESVITQAAAIGVKTAQFIGGEPALHPALGRLIRHALGVGVRVNVFSNLTHVTEGLWELFQRPNITLATSWYAADPATHAAITGNKAAYAGTRAGIARAVRAGIPIRAGIIAVRPGQDTAAAEAEVRALGVSQVTVRRVQGVGRAAGDGASDPAELCGRCGSTVAAVLPDGTLTPCVLGRWLDCGNVRETPLAAILAGGAWQRALAVVPRRGLSGCNPDCDPQGDTPNCEPDDESVCGPEASAPPGGLLPLAASR